MTAKKLIKYAEDLQDWIVESEMGLSLVRDDDGIYDEDELDKEDTFYPAYQQLQNIIDKLTYEVDEW